MTTDHKPQSVDLIEGLQILAAANGGDCHVAAEHDEIYAGGEVVPLSLKDQQRMEEIGWTFDADMGTSGRWTYFLL